MTQPLRDSRSEFGPRRLVFQLVVLVTLALFGLIGVVLFRPNLIAGLFGHDMAGHISGHFRYVHHRVHDLTFGFIFGTAIVGMLAQIRRPSENVAGQLMALVPWTTLLLISALTTSWVFAPLPILAVLTLAAATLHPSGRNLFRSFRVSRVNWAMLAMIVIAAVPLLALAITNVRMQTSVTNDHAALGHYGFMAAFSLTFIGTGLLASLRPTGWRLTAWVAGLLPALLGITSLMYPNVDSSLGPAWAVASIVWSVAFVVTTELTKRRATATVTDPSALPSAR